ncbi:hypothetical protein Tsac_2692 [Sporocytophaga myxococcoides]|uniref:Uncharacterized protein n=1 Tax=Sporocytophaga myxococcoides TaxID=153721 RepID=A0A098LHZ7_9BACT|nr:hypothetical protein [Sporocytophaga myxococcoides]GAL86057.1 hypothetical protein Tsac_2692 [Sporocytophaga myxococcoides]
MAAELTWAIKDGQYVNVNEFEPGLGLDCGCICPECGGQVGSRISRIKESCFFHFDKLSRCSGGQSETELHLESKRIFESHNYVVLKKGESNIKFEYSKVRLEQSIEGIRPDLILSNGHQDLIVEIAVTSFLKDKPGKVSILKSINKPVIEISLKEFYNAQNISEIQKSLKEELIEKTRLKDWIVYYNDDDESFKIIDKNWSLMEIALAAGVSFGAFCGIKKLLEKSRRKKSRKRKR